MVRTCFSCAFWNNNRCLIDNRAIPEAKRGESYCDLHKNHVDTCALCGTLIPSSGVILENNSIICKNCLDNLGTCVTCSKQSCSLEQDTSMPRTVFKTIQQGGFTVQTQALNPDLVAKHCPSCSCYKDNKCYRQEYRMCSNYTSILS